MSGNLTITTRSSMPNTIYGVNEIQGWNDRFSLEAERLKTYENWPLTWLDKQVLATTGMYYTGEKDKTECHFCNVIIGKWEQNDDPVGEHLRWSPHCPLLNRRTTNNIPQNVITLEKLLPPGKNSDCDIPPIPKWLSNPVPDYSIKGERLQTFTEWPRSMKQKPEQLAEAGFYYKGVGDCVVCFSCLGGLKDWEEDDDPWEQHALWMGHYCPFVKLNKGKEFIKSVVDRFNEYPSVKLGATGGGGAVIEVKPNPLKRHDSSDLDDSKMCKICFEHECNTAYVPCGHVVTCTQCAFSVSDCPVCRTHIENTVRIYFS